MLVVFPETVGEVQFVYVTRCDRVKTIDHFPSTQEVCIKSLECLDEVQCLQTNSNVQYILEPIAMDTIILELITECRSCQFDKDQNISYKNPKYWASELQCLSVDV